MENLQSIKRSINSAESLQSIVSTMKAHASSVITQFQNAAAASMAYRHVLDRGLYVVLTTDEEQTPRQHDAKGSDIHILFGSDHGLAGRFNERIVTFAQQNITPGAEDVILVVGQQILTRLEEGFKVDTVFPVPQTEEGITSMVQRLLLAIDDIRERVTVGRILLYYNKPQEAASFTEETERLFPIDLAELAKSKVEWESNTLPTYFVSRKNVFSHLIQHYFFITLYRAFCYSLASENASRLASMQAAEKNIDERLVELNAKYRRQRQNQITEEVNDVISGFKAIKKSKEQQG
ncbi:MAG: FoF1 ATP synthase subunit gamma [Bacillota bacterium]|nr:FoF1 ATP synthase subunit gamma [Bacillota bacterium]MDW7678553.1 FoF1 ATP synthase subunit gamma [Bacillota bacterium]